MNTEPNPVEIDEQDANDWYTRWRARIHEWIAQRLDPTLADILFFVPDLFALLINLLRDPRIPFDLKAKIGMVLAYVLLPTDLMPESLLGVAGLADDAGAMVLLLAYLKSLHGDYGDIMRQYWRGQGNATDVIDQLQDTLSQNADKFMNSRVWQAIKRRFDHAAEDTEPTPQTNIKQRVNITFD